MQKAGIKRAKCSGMMVQFKEKTILNAEQVELPILHLFTAVRIVNIRAVLQTGAGAACSPVSASVGSSLVPLFQRPKHCRPPIGDVHPVQHYGERSNDLFEPEVLVIDLIQISGCKTRSRLSAFFIHKSSSLAAAFFLGLLTRSNAPPGGESSGHSPTQAEIK